MATEKNQSCPICQDTWDGFYCYHQFCLGCILRWTHRNPVCPLCRRTIVTVQFSDHGEDDYLETSITVPEELPNGSSQAERAPNSLNENSSHPPVVSPSSSSQGTVSPVEQGSSGLEFVGGVLPEVQAELFRQQRHLLDPVRTWLRQRMETMYGNQWWLKESTLCYIVHFLCTYGPDQELMMQSLQGILEEHTVPLVQGTIDIIVSQCREQAQRLLRSHAAVDGDDSSEVSSSSSSSRSLRSNSWMGTPTSSPTVSMEEKGTGTTAAALCEGHSSSPPVPVPTEWDQPQEELGQEVVTVACPSAQGSSNSPSTP